MLRALITEAPRYGRALAEPSGAWTRLSNRHETLEPAPQGGPGYRCLWSWTSDLDAARALPGLGRRLMTRALAEHPISRATRLQQTEPPAITFVIGHRGMARLPHLLATLESIAAQQGPAIECVVVEQSEEPEAAPHLPAWVRHVHTPPPRPDMPYSRAWAFNIGALHARSPYLVLHDNDMLVPTGYARALLSHLADGWDVVNLKRFIFYLDRVHTEAVLSGSASLTAHAPEAITQNLEGGGSLAITAEAFQRIGGLDESFLGWGGEDNEFWERAQTLRVWHWAYLPIVHLWHSPQPGKQDPANPTLALFRARSAVPVQARIEALCARPRGRPEGPTGDAA